MRDKFFSKTALKGTSKRKRITFDKFSTIGRASGESTLCAIDAMNCTTADGKLAAGVGLSVYNTAGKKEVSYLKATEPTMYYTYKDYQKGLDYVGLMNKSGEMMYIDENNWSIKIFKSFSSEMHVYNCVWRDLEEVMVAVGEAGFFSYRKTGNLQSDLKGIHCACECRDRFFICYDKNVVRYSEPLLFMHLNQTLDGSGRLYLPSNLGEPVAMVAYSQNVYIFYPYHIIEIKTAGAARDFKVGSLPYTGGKITKNGARVFGDKLLFLAEDGVYIFDGNTIKKGYEELNIQTKTGSDICNNAIVNGKLLLRYVNRAGADATVVLYPDGKYGYFTTPLRGLGDNQGRVFCVYKNKMYNVQENAYIPSGEFRYFHSAEQDFGRFGVKTLKALHFEGVGAVDIDVYVDGVKKTERPYVRFVDGKATLRFDLRGESFAFLFWVGTGTELWRMTAEVEYV